MKFQYLEQKAKDQYIKTIVSDDAPSITAADNEEQRQENEKKKQELKEVKEALAEMHSNTRSLAPLVEQGGFFLPPHTLDVLTTASITQTTSKQKHSRTKPSPSHGRSSTHD